jgi:DNA-directed RNA polymerase specialized sigma24 family protein
MESHPQGDRSAVEAWFAEVFAHLGFITSYARHRGARDADGIAGEAMAIAWRRLADIPVDDSRPWLINTARNLLLSERRREPATGSQWLDDLEVEAPAEPLAPELDLDPELAELVHRSTVCRRSLKELRRFRSPRSMARSGCCTSDASRTCTSG